MTFFLIKIKNKDVLHRAKYRGNATSLKFHISTASTPVHDAITKPIQAI